MLRPKKTNFQFMSIENLDQSSHEETYKLVRRHFGSKIYKSDDLPHFFSFPCLRSYLMVVLRM